MDAATFTETKAEIHNRTLLLRKAGHFMSIDALSSYFNSLSSILSTGNQTSTSSSSSSSEKNSTDFDRYISSLGSEAAPLPSENYNDILTKISAASSASEDSSATEYGSVSQAPSEAGGSTTTTSEDGTTTTTEVIMVDGKPYLQTTVTDADGNVTVTQEPLGDKPPMDDRPPMPPMDGMPPMPPMDETFAAESEEAAEETASTITTTEA